MWLVTGATGPRFFTIKVPFDLAKFAELFTPSYYILAKVESALRTILEVWRSNANISHDKATPAI